MPTIATARAWAAVGGTSTVVENFRPANSGWRANCQSRAHTTGAGPPMRSRYRAFIASRQARSGWKLMKSTTSQIRLSSGEGCTEITRGSFAGLSSGKAGNCLTPQAFSKRTSISWIGTPSAATWWICNHTSTLRKSWDNLATTFNPLQPADLRKRKSGGRKRPVDSGIASNETWQAALSLRTSHVPVAFGESAPRLATACSAAFRNACGRVRSGISRVARCAAQKASAMFPKS